MKNDIQTRKMMEELLYDVLLREMLYKRYSDLLIELCDEFYNRYSDLLNELYDEAIKKVRKLTEEQMRYIIAELVISRMAGKDVSLLELIDKIGDGRNE